VRPLEEGLIVSEDRAGGTAVPRTHPGPDDVQTEEEDPALLIALKENRRKWEQLGFDQYQFRFQRTCFCVPEYTRPAILRVRDGRIEAAEYADTGEAVDVEHFGRYETIEGLFALIREVIDQEADRIDVAYDEMFGYPTSLYIDRYAHMADEEQQIEVRELRPLR
jgi:hypothetical protein